MSYEGDGQEHNVVEFVLRTFAFGLFHLAACGEDPASAAKRQRAEGEPAGNGIAQWESVTEPSEIAGAMGFTTLACGESTCVGITPEGDVHYWEAHRRGAAALSRGFGVEWSLSTLKDSAGHRLQLRDIALGRASAIPSCEEGSPPSGITAIALMDSGDVYTAERAYASPNDAGSSSSTAIWQAVPCMQAQLVVSVACGAGFCLALTARGDLWVWGSSDAGALGVCSPQVTRLEEPVRVGGALAAKRVAAVACGDEHVVAATCDEPDTPGCVFTWGRAANGRLGYELEDHENQPEPKMVPWITSELGDILRMRREALADPGTQSQGLPVRAARRSLPRPQRISQLACGARHSTVLCEGGLLCFGADDVGQLGLPHGEGEAAAMNSQGVSAETQDQEAAASRTKAPWPSFASAPALMRGGQEAVARRICCGPLHSAAVSLDGHLYVWGLDLTRASQDGVLRGQPRVRCLPHFSSKQPVVALTCGAHFVIASAEVELSSKGEAPKVHQAGAKVDAHVFFGGMDGGVNGGRNMWRPANLPQKSEDELFLHENLVRDMERNFYQRQEQQRKQEEQRRAREFAREQRMQEATEVWLTQLLPSYVPGSRPSKQMEQMWRRGVPPKVREALWPLAIGNVLRITPQLYDIHKQKAAAARGADKSAEQRNVLVTCSADESVASSTSREGNTQCIPFDLPRTFPNLAFFNEGGPMHEDCARILEAYTFFRPDIGYVQGMTFLAAMLLLYLPSYPAFVGLCNLINSPSVLGLYRLEPKAVECRATTFRRFCAMQLPAVARRLEEVGATPELFLIEWFMTIYAKCLSIDCASVVWDLFLLDGEVVLYCTAIALFRICEQPILALACDDLQGCAKILGEDMRERAHDPDELIWHIHEVERRMPAALREQIRDIENMEFMSPGLSSPSVGGLPSVSAASGQRARWVGPQTSFPGSQLLADARRLLRTRSGSF